jgi:4-hydroxy-3-methylbut-2-enyl diphosphate reductase
MEIIVSPFAGFCYGVQRAMEMARRAAEKGPVYSLGPLIHNPRAVRDLETRGVTVVQSLDDVPPGALVLFRTHGVEKETEEEARRRELNIVDTTCPFVKTAQNKARFLHEKGYTVLIFGEKMHPEVRSLYSYTEGQARVMNSPDELGDDVFKKAGVVSQTTRSRKAFSLFCGEVLRKSQELRIFNTICLATTERQEDAVRIARKADFMIVVGGRNSANTRKLYDIVREIKPALHVESADELRVDELTKYDTIGITAGASTPDTSIRELTSRLKNYFGG